MNKYYISVLLMLVFLTLETSCKDKNGDKNKPFIVVNPPDPLNWAFDLPYIDPGAEAYDVTETGDTVNINDRLQTIDNVDVAVPGNYKVFYNVSDEAGNEADEKTRDVKVVIAK